MSRFIPAGQSDLKTQEATERLTSQQIREEEEENEIPSLYEQMRMNHERKEQEFREKMNERNSVFKIREKELDFYNKIKEEKAQKEKEEKQMIEEGLKKFEQMKKSTPPETAGIISPTTDSSFKPTINPKTLKKTSSSSSSSSSLGIKKKTTTAKPKINEKMLKSQISETEQDPKSKATLSSALNNYSSDSD